tara:strand:+ start:419 stop:583 length:165 start_codon:yes stop_codon:yes gene_type:complete
MYNHNKSLFESVLKQAVADAFSSGDNRFSGRFGIFTSNDDDEMLEDEDDFLNTF